MITYIFFGEMTHRVREKVSTFAKTLLTPYYREQITSASKLNTVQQFWLNMAIF
jgi:hypothetical protein